MPGAFCPWSGRVWSSVYRLLKLQIELREIRMLNGISKTLTCVFGLCLGCAFTSSASAQVVMMGGNSYQTGAISVGQPRVVGFQPAGYSNFAGSNVLSMNSGTAFIQPSPTFSGPVMYSTSGLSSLAFNGIASPAVVGTTSGYGRIVRIRYRVPVYGRVQTKSTCGPCGN